MRERQVAHLACADHQHGLIRECIENFLCDINRHARDRELPLPHPRLFADLLADPQGILEHPVQDRPDRPRLPRGAKGVADLAENLPLTQHQALKARGDPKEVADGRLRRDKRAGVLKM